MEMERAVYFEILPMGGQGQHRAGRRAVIVYRAAPIPSVGLPPGFGVPAGHVRHL